MQIYPKDPYHLLERLCTLCGFQFAMIFFVSSKIGSHDITHPGCWDCRYASMFVTVVSPYPDKDQ